MSKKFSKKISMEEAKVLLKFKVKDFRNKSKAFDLLLSALEQNNITWALVGGAPRTWVLESEKESIPNDIDIAINICNKDVEKVINYLSYCFIEKEIESTKLHGFRLKTEIIDFDLWAANETIGVKKGILSDSNLYRSISRSAALSLDSLVFTSRGGLYEKGFFRTLETGVLSLNHNKVENPKSVAKKAIRLSYEYNYVLDFPLQFFIEKNLNIKKKESANKDIKQLFCL